MDKNDHPGLDDTELLTGQSIQHYLTMIGQLQWLVTLGRFDIYTQVPFLVQVHISSNKRTSGKATKDLWLCQKDLSLFSQIQD